MCNEKLCTHAKEVFTMNKFLKCFFFSEHKNWVLVTTWSPDSCFLASACKNGKIIIWDPKTGKQVMKYVNLPK